MSMRAELAVPLTGAFEAVGDVTAHAELSADAGA